MDGYHGHVIPALDGSRARCGGPKHCEACRTEQKRVHERATEMHQSCMNYWATLPRDVQVTQHGWDAHYEDARLVLFQERYPPARPAESVDRPTPEAHSSPPPPGGTIQSADLEAAHPQVVPSNVRTKVAAGVYVWQSTGRIATLNEPVFRVEVESPPPPRPDRMTSEVEKRLFEILAEHDTDVWIRNSDRTQSSWPDLSDIHDETRRKVLDLMRVRDVLDRQDHADLPLDLTAVSDYRVWGQQVFSIKPEEPIDPSGYLNQVVLINGKRYRVTNVERHPVNERVNRLPFGLRVIPA